MSRLTIQEVIEHCERTVRTIEKQHENYQDWFELKPTPISMKRYWEHKQTAEWLKELQHYKDLEEQGRLIELPCAVGDTVYEVQKIRKRIQEYTIISIHYSHISTLIGWEIKDGKGIYSNLHGFEVSAIGKTVFLTKEEAEAKLAEMKCGAE